MKWFFKTDSKQGNIGEFQYRTKQRALQLIATADLNLECAKFLLATSNSRYQFEIHEIEKTRKEIEKLILKIDV